MSRPEIVRSGEASVLTRLLRDMLEPKHRSGGLFGTAAKLREADDKIESVAEVIKDNISETWVCCCLLDG